MTYDRSGNITRLERWDNQDIMNMLHYTYDGNQVTKVTDMGYYPVDYSCKRYMDLADVSQEMEYDANGNLIYDLDRQIVAIRYNILNLLDTVQFANGNQIINHYDALGTRYKTSYRTRKVAATVPVGTTLSATDNVSDYILLTHAMDKNMKYLASGNSALTLEYVFNAEGYYANITDAYFYYVKDHLGNIRETYVYPWANYKECVQRMQYYPSGLPWNENFGAMEHPYRYNGKEFVEMHGLDEYDSEARWYYPALGRTTTIDPLAEKYYDISPYAWCGNNPVSIIDPDGKEGVVVSGSPGNHNNKLHFLINGINRALKVQKELQNGEKTTWIIYNDKERGFHPKDLEQYIHNAKMANINVLVFSEVDDIINYMNNKTGDNSRLNDQISMFYYIGHSTPGDLDVGYADTGQNFDPSDLNSTSFREGAYINVIGGCRTAIDHKFLGIPIEKSIIKQFSEILDKTSIIHGADVRVEYPGGVVSDEKLLEKNEGKIITIYGNQ